MAELLRLLKLAGIARCFLQVILVIFSRGKNLLRAVFAGGRETCVPRREEEHVVHFHFFFRAVIGEVGLIHGGAAVFTVQRSSKLRHTKKVSSTFKQRMSGRDRLWRSVQGSWD